MPYAASSTRRLKFIVRKHDYGRATTIECAIIDDLTGVVSVAQPVQFVERADDETVSDGATMMRLSPSVDPDAALQDLMDQLWALGVRPKDIGTPGHLAATKEHLADMRALAFAAVSKALDVEVKP